MWVDPNELSVRSMRKAKAAEPGGMGGIALQVGCFYSVGKPAARLARASVVCRLVISVHVCRIAQLVVVARSTERDSRR